MKKKEARILSNTLYLNEKEASQRYGMSVSWFQRMRWKGGGPAYAKLAGKVLYPIAGTDEFFASKLRTSTSEQA